MAGYPSPGVKNAPLLRPVAVCAGVGMSVVLWLTNVPEWFSANTEWWLRRGGGLSAVLAVFSRTEWWPGIRFQG
ncbi:MAG: hypothetical protein HQL80_13690 [Magnetococcales bacterium]|nr:hypothetical protein [Magnetococcales bacterium]